MKKIKNFFVVNKDKILHLLKLISVILGIWLLSIWSISLGYNLGSNKQDINYNVRSLNIEKKNVLGSSVGTGYSTMITNIVSSDMADGQLVVILNIDSVNLNYDFDEVEIELIFTLLCRFYYTNDSYIEQIFDDNYCYFYGDGQFNLISDLEITFFPHVIINEGGLDTTLSNPSLDLYFESDVSVYSDNDEYNILDENASINLSFSFAPNIPNQSIGEDLVSFLTAIDDYGLKNMRFNNRIHFNLDVFDKFYDDGYREGYNSGNSAGQYQGYNEGYEAAINELGRNIFTYLNVDNSPILLVLDDTTWIQPDDYDESLLFKHNYLDLQYLRTLYANTYNRYRIVWNESNYSLNNLYLTLDNSELNDYNIIVNGKSYIINSTSKLNIESSNLLQYMEFDNLILTSTRLINSSVEYAYGYNTGYNQGYDEGYLEGEVDQEDYYEELIIPSIKNEYYQNGYDDGYNYGYDVGQNNGNPIIGSFDLIGRAFTAINPILNIPVFGSITIGSLVVIPLVISIIFVIIKLISR